MYNGTGSKTLKILVVTEDRALQRELSGFFELVGYQLLQAADRKTALAAAAAGCPQIVLLDAELGAAADWELCRQLSQRPSEVAGFKFLLVDEPDESQLQDALEAGIDDFLVKPVSYGELLSRLRVAARVLEYDRRVGQQGRIDPRTGLLSRSAFTAHLRRQLTEHAGAAPRVACAVLDIDFFARAGRVYGASAADTLSQAVAQKLNGLRVGSEVLGCLGADRFCVMLPGADEAAAVQWAEKAREAVAAEVFTLGETTVKFTISLGVAGCEAGEGAEQLIERAVRALEAAKNLGRNCVVAWSGLDAQAADSLEIDKLFQQTMVRDVMTPCTVYLEHNQTTAEAIDLLDRTRLDAIGVVDAKGKLLGVCQRADFADAANTDDPQPTLIETMTTDVQTFDQRESLASLISYFTGNAASLVVVVDDGRPVGFVACDSLVMLSRPVEVDSLAADSQYDDTTAYLFVPDVSLPECEPAV